MDTATLMERAKSGDLSAMEELADSYYYGKNELVEDDEQAASWYRKAVELDPNSLVGLNGLGNCYYYGHGVEKDQGLALVHYVRAAELGYARAQNNLGDHLMGRGDPSCVAWFDRAVSSGNAYAAYRLSKYYGDEAHYDRDKKRHYLQIAADRGSPEGMMELGWPTQTGQIAMPIPCWPSNGCMLPHRPATASPCPI